MSIQVGDEVSYSGDIGTVLAVAGTEASVLFGNGYGLGTRGLSDLTRIDPKPAPEPPLSGEQMAYVLETVGKAMGDPVLIAAAKEFRK